MNKSEKISEDILSRYINPDKIEIAPEGFTEKIMTRIQIEKSYSPVTRRYLRNFKVPLISLVITISLIIPAILGSANGKDSMFFSFFEPLLDKNIVLPAFNFDKFTGFTLPGWLVYIAIGIFFLSLFDRVLNTFFNRERK